SVATHSRENRTLAFSVVRLGTDDIPNTLDIIDASGSIDYSKLKSFASADYAFYLSYAVKTKIDGLRYGGSVKVVHRIVGEFAHAWGFGFDLGAQYQKGNWMFGALGKDVTSTFNAWTFNTETFAPQFASTHQEIPENSTEVTLPKL